MVFTCGYGVKNVVSGLESWIKCQDSRADTFKFLKTSIVPRFMPKRELSAYLRDMGNTTGGPAPFGKRDRSRFLQHLDGLIQAVLRGK